MRTSLGISLLLSAAAFLFHAGASHAEEYPSRPVHIVVALTPGTGPDLIARRVGEKFRERLGQPAVVENRPGLSGHLGAEAVSRAAPDGYTLLVTTSSLPMTATLYADRFPKFNPLTDLAPLTSVSSGRIALVASTKAGVRTFEELIARAKANPGKVTYATPGAGHPFHFSMEYLQEEKGIKLMHVPYKGTAPALNDLIAGHVDVMFASTHTVAPYVKRGQLAGIASLTAKRHPLLPDVPSFGELGANIHPVHSNGWFGFLAPAGVPAPIQEKLSAEIRKILLMPDVKESLEKIGLEIEPTTSAEMRAAMKAGYEENAVAIRKYNVQP